MHEKRSQAAQGGIGAKRCRGAVLYILVERAYFSLLLFVQPDLSPAVGCGYHGSPGGPVRVRPGGHTPAALRGGVTGTLDTLIVQLGYSSSSGVCHQLVSVHLYQRTWKVVVKIAVRIVVSSRFTK